MLTAWGIVCFRNLPIEAYPDVANNYVQIITQWPGRSAEEIERQVTVPVEIQMAGIPHLTHLRSTTLAGLSSLMLIFDDDSTSDVNREHVLERLSQVNLPAGLVPQMGTDWSPVGQIYWYTLESTNPAYDVMEKKSLEDWTLEKSFKGVPGVVDVSSFGGPPRSTRSSSIPEKLVSYGLSIAQVEQQIANNNTNGGGSFIEQGAQQINVQSRRPLHQRAGHREHRRQDPERRGHSRSRTLPPSTQGPKIPPRPDRHVQPHRRRDQDGKSSTTPTPSKASSCCKRATTPTPCSKASTRKSTSSTATDHPGILPNGVKIVPFLDRSRPGPLHLDTVDHNLTEGMFLVVHHSVSLPRQHPRRHHRRPHHSLCAAVRRHLPGPRAHSRQSALAGRAGLRNGRRRLGGDDREHRPPSRHGPGDARTPTQKIREAAHEVQRPVFFARGIIITAYLPIFTLQAVEGRLFKPMAWTVTFALIGALVFAMLVAPVLASILLRKGASEWQNPIMIWLTRPLSRRRPRGHCAPPHHGRHRRLRCSPFAIYLTFGGPIGSEFLPHLDEGSIWVRGTLPPSEAPPRASTSPTRRASASPHSLRSPRSSARPAAPTTAPTPPASSTPSTSSISSPRNSGGPSSTRTRKS